MGFVSDALQQLECAGGVAEAHRFAFTRSINFFEFLGQSNDGQAAQPEFCQFRASGIQLPLAAVNQDQIGQVRRADLGRYRGVPARRARLLDPALNSNRAAGATALSFRSRV